MKKLNLLKNSFVLLIIPVFTLMLATTIRAEDADSTTSDTSATAKDSTTTDTTSTEITRIEWNADESLVVSPIDAFAQPVRYVYVDLAPNSEYSDKKDYVKELYYFLTFKMGLGDMPFHYLQDEDGTVYTGNSSGYDAILPVKGFQKGDVIIGYIGDSFDFSKAQASANFKKGLTQIIDDVKIAPSAIVAKKYNLVIDLENQASLLTFEDTAKDDAFAKAIDTAKKDFVDVKVPEKSYQVEFVGVQYNKDPEANSTVEVGLELKNTGEDNFYLGGDSELYLATNDEFDHKSKFYINGDWANESRIALMDESNSVLRKGDKALFKFNVHVPLASGEQKDSFIVVDKKGDKFDKSKFDITFVLKLGDLKVLEIKETETGFLRVRETASGFSKEVAKVLSGERFEYLQRSDAGYYEIKYSGDKTGWVSGQYVDVISLGGN
ncbi:SH3 domain-containing protein [Candidatus Dojkabacteria bacterium]|uniref:SH3 domain-containing protein n=1 Tax=Candidatus Dojkabacteria bacterium TaxID=2099670 RepID=A0A955L2Z6_9BACT|nr:SH3 domain-containing protein [Candidatus Dojkabacteria bacterium]